MVCKDGFGCHKLEGMLLLSPMTKSFIQNVSSMRLRNTDAGFPSLCTLDIRYKCTLLFCKTGLNMSPIPPLTSSIGSWWCWLKLVCAWSALAWAAALTRWLGHTLELPGELAESTPGFPSPLTSSCHYRGVWHHILQICGNFRWCSFLQH